MLVYRDSGRLERGAEVAWSAQPDWDDLNDRPRRERRHPPLWRTSHRPARILDPKTYDPKTYKEER